jgi:ATP-dependent 26S proteasome regulatory subunit
VLVELVAQMDGFDGDSVRVIMATNCPNALNPALLHPGWLDRRVEPRRESGASSMYGVCLN